MALVTILQAGRPKMSWSLVPTAVVGQPICRMTLPLAAVPLISIVQGKKHWLGAEREDWGFVANNRLKDMNTARMGGRVIGQVHGLAKNSQRLVVRLSDLASNRAAGQVVLIVVRNHK